MAKAMLLINKDVEAEAIMLRLSEVCGRGLLLVTNSLGALEVDGNGTNPVFEALVPQRLMESFAIGAVILVPESQQAVRILGEQLRRVGSKLMEEQGLDEEGL